MVDNKHEVYYHIGSSGDVSHEAEVKTTVSSSVSDRMVMREK